MFLQNYVRCSSAFLFDMQTNTFFSPLRPFAIFSYKTCTFCMRVCMFDLVICLQRVLYLCILYFLRTLLPPLPLSLPLPVGSLVEFRLSFVSFPICLLFPSVFVFMCLSVLLRVCMRLYLCMCVCISW